jgi:hypothetical protein
MNRRLTAPLPIPKFWGSITPEKEFNERLEWYRRQPPPPPQNCVIRLFVHLRLSR